VAIGRITKQWTSAETQNKYQGTNHEVEIPRKHKVDSWRKKHSLEQEKAQVKIGSKREDETESQRESGMSEKHESEFKALSSPLKGLNKALRPY
jgi:hypothetical protein